VTASLTNAAGNTGEAAGDTYNSIENFTGSTFGDTLEGNAGANTIRSGGGQDVVTGGAGSDSLLGGEANDTLNGGVGGDTLNGGAGSDLATYQDAAAGVVASLANIAINTGEAAGDVYTSIERLTGSDFADSLNGANVVLNTLRGGLGNDTLKGATGNDFLEGGGDDDTFVFNTALNAATNVDTILDFTQADDTIHLDQTFFSQIVLGALAGSAFKNLSAAAVDAGDRILYDPGTGEIFYDANGSVAGQRTLFAKVDPGTLLNHTDFFVTP
jgi:Ca2+-binding RTX toxin-like protein